MWFKNLQIYRLTTDFDLTPEQLEQALAAHPARECGPLEQLAIGWAPPLGRLGSQLVHAVGGCMMICASRSERILPGAVVKEELEQKIDEIEHAEQRKLRRQEKQELKEQLVTELLPRAFTRSRRSYAYIDPQQRWLIVDAASTSRAEELITLLRDSLTTLPLRPLQLAHSPTAVMTAWLSGGHPGAGFEVLEECELRDPLEDGGIVRCRRQNLASDEIRAHLDAGKQAVRLALDWSDRLQFLFADDLSVRRLRFLDSVLEEAAEAEAGDEVMRFDTDFALMSLELRRFLPQLFEQFGGAVEE